MTSYRNARTHLKRLNSNGKSRIEDKTNDFGFHTNLKKNVLRLEVHVLLRCSRWARMRDMGGSSMPFGLEEDGREDEEEEDDDEGRFLVDER